MESKMLNEIYRLKHQIKQYQQKVNLLNTDKINCHNKSSNFVKSNVHPDIKNLVYHSNPKVSNSKMLLNESTNNVYVKSQLCTTNVYVNPNFKNFKPQNATNFKPQNATVHINPNIQTKPLIHINPKVINNIANSNQNLQNNTSTINLSTTKPLVDNNTIHKNVQRSIYVNPTLLKKLSSSSEGKLISHKESIIKEQPACSRLKCAKSVDYRKKSSNSSIVLLSQRKLVRVTRTLKNTSKISPYKLSQYKLFKSTESMRKRFKTISPKIIKVKPLINNTLQSTNVNSNLLKVNINKSSNKSKVTKYKIDRTTLYVPKSKRVDLQTRKVINNNVAQFVTIGGIVYKASKNKLIRRSTSLKRKRLNSGKNDKLGADKKQRINKETLNRKLETSITNKTRLSSNILPKATYKNSISNKAKQRSIRILRNKMHKNNQPCLIFQHFGSCPNIKNGVCPKRHDKKQVSLCRRFLQGKCFLDKCPLSHDVGPEKMPTCKYFLDGCCTRDACPYLHVKVSSTTSICIDFLQGYCVMGNKCQRRHENLCPEFDKLGICSKGECCPYPHKSHSIPEKTAKYPSKTRDVQKHKVILATKDDSETSNLENRLRYYEVSDGLSEDLEKKKEILTVHSTKQISDMNEVNKPVINEDAEITTSDYSIKRKKISISSYIPIDSSS